MASESEAISVFEAKCVGAFAALGPLLLIASMVLLYFVFVSAHSEADVYIYGTFTSLALVAIGLYLTHRSLHHIAKKQLEQDLCFESM